MQLTKNSPLAALRPFAWLPALVGAGKSNSATEEQEKELQRQPHRPTHSPAQLWLQHLLASLPLTGPGARMLAGNSIDNETSFSGRQQQQEQQRMPRNLNEDDRYLWEMFMVSGS
jgi:hypothetical protein